MASGITYDGVDSAEGGNIFKDMSFWVAHRVPMRNDILNKIQSNGGKVVPLEKNADLLIADHARKDAPPGSFSWKFIQDSVENGIAQVPDKYRIGPDPDAARPVAGGGLTRSGRVPFTHADDAALAKWVLSKPGEPRLGNDLYQAWEQINPRHTWQSWRNRWAKKLHTRTEHELRMLAATAPDLPDVTSTVTRPKVEAPGTAQALGASPQIPVATAMPVQYPSPPPAASVAPSQAGRVPFTPEDDAIVALWALAHKGTLVKRHFVEIEEQYPHHGWDSWRTRWNKKLRKYPPTVLRKMADTVPDEEPEAPMQQIGTVELATAPMRSAPKQAARVESKPVVKTTVTVSAVAVQEQTSRQAEPPTTRAQQTEGPHGSEEPEEEQATATPIVPDDAEEGEVELILGEASQEDDEDEDPQRDQFYQDLINFLDCEPKDFSWPIISGRTGDFEIDLFDLAQAVEAQQVAHEDIDWAEVTRALGWTAKKDAWLGPELEKCWDERLQEFLEAMNDFAPDNDEGEEEGGDEVFEEEAAMPSSPPVPQESLKRPRGPEPIPSIASVRKRRRLLEGAEIPSTPDEQVGISKELRRAHELSLSPTAIRASGQTSQQLPLFQRTPGKPTAKNTSPLPLDFGTDLAGLRGRKEQDTSDDELPSLGAILRANGNSKAAKRRTLPASFSRDTTTRPPSRNSRVENQSSPPQPSVPRANTHTLPLEDSPAESAADWVARHLRTGYPRKILNLALHTTSLLTGAAAEHVVDSLTNENGIPTDLPGVWLPGEDRVVKRLMEVDLSEQAADAVQLTEQKMLREEQRRLIERHTWEGLSRRKRYLRKKRNEDKARKRGTSEGRKTVDVEVEVKPTPRARVGSLTAEEKRKREMELRKMLEG